MNINEDFLNAYKDLESELRETGLTVLDYENGLKAGNLEKLKVCRIMRNYMSHNDKTFLIASKDQVKFLNELALEIRKTFHTVKDEMKKLRPIPNAKTPIKDVIVAVNKNGYAVMTNKKDLYIVDKDILISELAKGNKKIIFPARLPKYSYTTKTEKISCLHKGLYIVTSDGTETGKYEGIVII